MMGKVKFDYTPGDMYPFKATVVMGENDTIFGSSNMSFDQAEVDVIGKVKQYQIGQSIKIPEPKMVEV
jgi:hypothetical protein